jgi:hypothetical protein
MTNLQRSPLRGRHAWVLVALTILAIDLTAQPDETLTAACHRALKRQPFLTGVAIGVTSLHLAFGSSKYRRIDCYRVIEALRRWMAPVSIDIPL